MERRPACGNGLPTVELAHGRTMSLSSDVNEIAAGEHSLQSANSAALPAASPIATEHTTVDYLPWVEKYRPAQLDGVISHEHIVGLLQSFVTEKQLPHMLFYGPPGTGKTSTALACARMIYGDNFYSMILLLNASDERGIKVVRGQIKDFVSTAMRNGSGTKLVILDEADSMTAPAQHALRRGNYANKIIPALASRCVRFRFAPVASASAAARLQDIGRAERVNVTAGAIDAIVRFAHGDMRQCINTLQSASMSFDHVDERAVYLCTGNPEPEDIRQMMQWLVREDVSVACKGIQELGQRKGIALIDTLCEIEQYIDASRFGVAARITLLSALAEIECRLAQGASEKLQTGALVAAFQEARGYECRASANKTMLTSDVVP